MIIEFMAQPSGTPVTLTPAFVTTSDGASPTCRVTDRSRAAVCVVSDVLAYVVPPRTGGGGGPIIEEGG